MTCCYAMDRQLGFHSAECDTCKCGHALSSHRIECRDVDSIVFACPEACESCDEPSLLYLANVCKERDRYLGGGLTYDQLVVACKNIGYDLTCGGCASIFYTGTEATHVCGKPNEGIAISDGHGIT